MPDTVDTLFSSPRLWFNETAQEFESLRAELQREVRCNGVIEKIYVNDMAELLFEIRRLRYIKSDMIFKARPEALISIIKLCLKDSMKLSRLGVAPDAGPLAKMYSQDFLENGRNKQKVLDMLRDAGLDERAIDAEACRQVFSELQMVDKLLVSAEARFPGRSGPSRSIVKALRSRSKVRRGNSGRRLAASCARSGDVGLNMATEKQIEANRRNASRSTARGPKRGKSAPGITRLATV